MSRDTVVTDYFPFLTELGESGQEYFIEGGQAVNFLNGFFDRVTEISLIPRHHRNDAKNVDAVLAELSYIG